MPSTTGTLGISRAERDREIVRRTAELLATDLPLKDVFAQLCALLVRFVDASRVAIALREELDESADAFGVLHSGKAAIKAGLRGSESAVLVPLKFGNETIGVLSVAREGPGAFDDQDVEMLETCAMYVAVRVYVAQQSTAKAALEDLALHDALTGVANRRAFDERLRMEWDRAIRSHTPLSLVMCDIDYFKLFNDGYGHVAGDGCLQAVAGALAGCMARPADLFARYGGEEFVALLPESEGSGAIVIAEKMRAAVTALNLPHEGSSLKRVSISLGVATTVPIGGEPGTLIQAADKLLYAAKTSGRNRVVAEDHQSATPAADRLRRVKHNLPLQLTDFVGRGTEIADLKAALSNARLVTLAGPGGIGKTRLSLRVANETLENYPHGVWFIELALQSEPESIPTAIASVLGLQASQSSSIVETIESFLRGKRVLLVFDNCEHVIEASARIADRLLRGCPELTILASSREPLGVPGELTYRVPSLAVPPPGAELSAGDPSQYDSLRLFAARASASQHGFVITSDNIETVAQICRRLDGIALAIELAAARLKNMTVVELARRLDDRFRVLTGGSRTLLPRQQTLRALIDWSFTLLRTEEKAVMLRLSMFAGGWTLEAASDVCSDDSIEPWQVTDILEQLVDKSLVNAEQDGAHTRYRFGESTRDYAREMFASLEDASQFRDRHVRYYASLAANAAAAWPQTPTRAWLPPLKKEDDNFRTALEWSVGERQDIASGTELALALVPYWDETGVRLEALRWLEAALAQNGDSTTLAQLKLAIATFLRRVNVDTERQTRLAREAQATFAESGDQRSVAWSLVAQAIAALQEEIQTPDSIPQLKEAERIFRDLDDRLGLIDAVNGLGIALEAESAVAMAMYTEALNLARGVGHDLLVARSLANMGHIYLNEGSIDHALSSIKEALAIEERYGARSAMAWDSSTLACIEYLRGNVEGARTYALDAIDECVIQRGFWLLRECLISVALIASESSEPSRAAMILGYIDAMSDLPPLQHLVDSLYRKLRAGLEAALAPAQYLALHAKGAVMHIDEIVALAKDRTKEAA